MTLITLHKKVEDSIILDMPKDRYFTALELENCIKNHTALTEKEKDKLHSTILSVLSENVQKGVLKHNDQVAAKYSPNGMYQESEYLINTEHPLVKLRNTYR